MSEQTLPGLEPDEQPVFDINKAVGRIAQSADPERVDGAYADIEKPEELKGFMQI